MFFIGFIVSHEYDQFWGVYIQHWFSIIAVLARDCGLSVTIEFIHVFYFSIMGFNR